MCGIVGVFGRITKNEEDAFKDMLVFDQVRGDHSTGVASLSLHGGVTSVKKLGTPDNLFDSVSFTDMMRKSHKALIGHNRYATVGGRTVSNAHPFTHGDLTGIHNGTLRDYNSLDGEGQFGTDTETVYHHASIHGMKKTIANIRGAFAFVWLNEKDKTLNMVRNTERPLYIAMSKDGQTGFFASEYWMILAACSRRKVPIELDKVKLLTEGWITTFDLSVNGDINKPSKTKVEEKQLPVASSFRSNVQAVKGRTAVSFVVKGFTRESNQTVYHLEEVLSPTYKARYNVYNGSNQYVPQLGEVIVADFSYTANSIPVYTNARAGEVVEKEEEPVEYRDHKGNVLSLTEFLERYPYCSWCSDSIDPDDEDNVVIGRKDIVCSGCVEHDEVRPFLTGTYLS